MSFDYSVYNNVMSQVIFYQKGSLTPLHASILRSNNHSSLRCLYYPPIPNSMEERQVRLAEHTDYGCMTLLFQDAVGGLQVTNFAFLSSALL